jgi:polar amino acid transport system substrate-binding protein
MKITRREFGAALSACLLGVLGACASINAAPPANPAVAVALAPSGSLRVGVYPGSPSSLVRDASTGKTAGVTYELGHALGKQLGVPVTVVEFKRAAEIIEALKAGQVDFTVTNASPARAREVDFTPPLLQLELGLLVPPQSPITAFADADRPGLRIGVSTGGSSAAALPQRLKAATVVPVASLGLAQQMLRNRQLDAFATNKGILFDMADALPGFQVLGDRWGAESLAIGVPKGRQAGQAYLKQFAQDMRQSGALQAMAARAGLRGLAATGD